MFIAKSSYQMGRTYPALKEQDEMPTSPISCSFSTQGCSPEGLMGTQPSLLNLWQIGGKGGTQSPINVKVMNSFNLSALLKICKFE